MQLSATRKFATIAEYLTLEKVASEKHEYRDGEIFAMAGNGPNHSLIAINFGGELRGLLKGAPCRVYESNLRIGIPGTPLFTYPDLSVIGGPRRMDPNDPAQMTATNPHVLVEILSPSTEAYDRGEKFNRYRKLDSLEDYILINQNFPQVEIFHRQPDGTWLFSTSSGLDALATIPSLNIQIPLSEIYSGVEFPKEPIPE